MAALIVHLHPNLNSEPGKCSLRLATPPLAIAFCLNLIQFLHVGIGPKSDGATIADYGLRWLDPTLSNPPL